MVFHASDKRFSGGGGGRGNSHSPCHGDVGSNHSLRQEVQPIPRTGRSVAPSSVHGNGEAPSSIRARRRYVFAAPSMFSVKRGKRHVCVFIVVLGVARNGCRLLRPQRLVHITAVNVVRCLQCSFTLIDFQARPATRHFPCSLPLLFQSMPHRQPRWT